MKSEPTHWQDCGECNTIHSLLTQTIGLWGISWYGDWTSVVLRSLILSPCSEPFGSSSDQTTHWMVGGGGVSLEVLAGEFGSQGYVLPVRNWVWDYSLPRLRRLDCEGSPDTVTDTVSSCALSSFLLALNLLILALIKQPHTHMTIVQTMFFLQGL